MSVEVCSFRRERHEVDPPEPTKAYGLPVKICPNLPLGWGPIGISFDDEDDE